MIVRHLSCAFLFLVMVAQAQIQTDVSLGSAQSLSGPDYVIDEDLGRRAGSNLFHSFSEFNVNTGESATFTGASGIANVISRVTGGGVSTIDGLLKSEIANANFYLINSAGILFGPNASLSINGSFHASTADYLRLGEGDRFYSEPLQGAILSTAAPVAFGFFGVPERGITVKGSQLDLEEGSTFSLVGAELTVKDGASIYVPQGQINLAAVGAEGEAVWDTSSGYQDLDTRAFEQLNAVTVKSDSVLDVTGKGGGRVVIRGGQLVLSDGAVFALTTGDQTGNGVDLAADQLRFVRSRIDTTTTGSGSAGTIRMAADTLVLNGVDGSEGVGIFASSTETSGKAGTIAITADQVDVHGTVGIEATAELPADTGTIDLTTSTLNWNGFDAAFQVNAGIGEWIRLGSGNIILDGSFDSNMAGVALDGPNYAITADMGQTFGNNLFHSFEVFFVDEAETATFSSLEPVSNIIARVTGDAMTSIYGQLISEIPGANLYLINPNGLFFGAGASLDLSGSFYTGSADYLTLGNGGRFDVSMPAESVLNDSAVSAYGFIDDDIGDITFESARLLLQDSHVFSLVGGKLSLINGSRVRVPSGQINLVSLQSAGEASIEEGSNDMDVSGFSELGDILVDDSATNVLSSQTDTSSPAGRLFVRSDDLRLDNDGEFRARNFGEGSGGSIDIVTSGDLFILENSGIEISGTGALGKVSVEAETITIDGTGQESFTGFDISTNGDLSSGGAIENNLSITATETFTIVNGGVVDVATFGNADAGLTTIWAKNLIIDQQGSREFTGIFSAVGDGLSTVESEGNSGELNIIVDERLQIKNGGFINSSTYSLGDGGNVTIQAKNLTVDSRSAILSTAVPPPLYASAGSDDTGNGGALDITVGEQLQIINGSGIDTSTFGTGDAGSIAVRAKNLIIDGWDFSFTGIASAAARGSTGNGGALDITVGEQLQIINGSGIDTSTFGTGDAGSIAVRAKNLIIDGWDFSFTGIASEAALGATGNGGELNIIAGEQLQISSGGILASAEIGNAGNLRISAGNDVRVENGILSISAGQEDFDVNDLDTFLQPELVVEVGNSISIQNSILETSAGVSGSGRGAGGDIYLRAPNEIKLQDSLLFSQAGYAGGNVFIDPRFYIVINTDVIAQADIQGGNYNVIVTEPFGWIQSTDSLIDLSGEQSGSILSNTSPFDLGAELSEIILSFLNAEDWALQPCKFRSGGTGSRLVVTDWRGVSNSTDDFLPSEPILLAEYDSADIEPIDDAFLQEVLFSEPDDGCDDCP